MEDADVETSSDAYARRFAGPVGEWFLRVQRDATLALLRPLGGPLRVLDVGGGHGQLAAPLADAGHDVTVLGSSDSCRPRVAALVDAGRVRWRAGDLLGLPFEARAFDVALAFRLLPHVAKWRALVAELCRVAARAAIVDYPSRRSANAAASSLFAAKKSVEGDTRPFEVFADADVAAAFAAHGFRVRATRRQFAVPMAAHRALGLAPASRAVEGAARLAGLTALLGSPVVARADRADG
jgi:2-polyprenyl-3-methyl-5-hydroxy-6-metoxy-1,4-benzoquinol methylase